MYSTILFLQDFYNFIGDCRTIYLSAFLGHIKLIDELVGVESEEPQPGIESKVCTVFFFRASMVPTSDEEHVDE